MKLTRMEFVEQFRHEFGGMVLDASTHGLSGKELSLFMRGIMRKIDQRLGDAYDALKEIEKPPDAKPTVQTPSAQPLRK